MTEPDETKLASLSQAMVEMEVSAEVIERVLSNPDETKLTDLGLDSKDLLLLDFHLEEAAGLNINFNALQDDMTVSALLAEIAPTEA